MYWDAFFEISLGRSFADSGRPESLSITDILMYLVHKDISNREDREEYLFLIRRLDNEYLKIVREQQERNRKQQAKAQKGVHAPRRRG